MDIEIQNGRYTAKVVCWGFTKTDKGSDQFAIEFDIDVHGPEVAPTRFTHFIGLSSEMGVDILDKQLAVCGWKGGDYGAIQLDTKTPVSLKIENDDYGPKVKFIDPVNGGGLIERKRMNDNDQRALIAKLNARAKSRPATGAPASAAATPRPAASASAKPAATKPRAPAPAPAPKTQPAQPNGDANADWGFDDNNVPI